MPDTNNTLQNHLTTVAKSSGALLVGYTYIQKIQSTGIILGFYYDEKTSFQNSLKISKRLNELRQLSNYTSSKIHTILRSEHHKFRGINLLAVYGDMRPLIQDSGLGTIGKNGLIVNPEYGSNLLYSLIFTDVIMKYPKNEQENSFNPCDKCNRCIKSCPVSAFKINRFKTYDCFIASAKGCKECVSHCINSKGTIGNLN